MGRRDHSHQRRRSPSYHRHHRSRSRYHSKSRSKHHNNHNYQRDHSHKESSVSSRGSTETIKASSTNKDESKGFSDVPPTTSKFVDINQLPTTSLIVKHTQPITTMSTALEIRSKIYNSKDLALGVYSNFHRVDISSISNIHRKLIIYNLPEVNDDEIQQYFITLLNHLSPNIRILNPIVSLEKRDNGFYYIIEVSTQDQVEILKNLDNTEWRGYRIRIQRPRNFFRDYNDTEGKIALPKEIKSNDTTSDRKLYMSGIPPSAKESEIRDIVESFGQLKYFNLIKDPNDENLNRGFCFFEYISDVSTERAIKGLKNLSMGDSKKFKVQKATVNNKSFTILQEIKNNQGNEDESNHKGFEEGFTDKNEFTYEQLDVPFYASTPSRVVQIINILTAEDLMDDDEYKEILEDIRFECMTFGTVLNVEIPRPDMKNSFASLSVGKIFVKFATIESAKRARYNLSGRKFNGRIAVGSFYPENYFDVRKFNYNEKENI